jgi:hypothetical protein
MSGSSIPSASSVSSSSSSAMDQISAISNQMNQETLQAAQERAAQEETQAMSSLITNGASGIKSAAGGQ